MQAKNTMPRKLGKKPQKAPFWEPKWLQKSTPEAGRSALGASCARLARQEVSKSAKKIQKMLLKSKTEFKTTFANK